MTYYRKNYRTRYSTTYSSGDVYCSDRQHHALLSMVRSLDEAMANATDGMRAAYAAALPGLAGLPTVCDPDSYRTVLKTDVSKMFDIVKGLLAVFQPALDEARRLASAEKASKYPGLPQHDRVMETRFDGKCVKCGSRTTAGTDLAVQVSGRWQAWCLPCAAGLYVKDAAADVADRFRSLVKQVLTEADVADQQKPRIGVAVPSGGHNDLDFLQITPRRVYRVIGGRSNQPLSNDVAITLLETVLSHGVVAAMGLYGQHLGRCGKCGRHLTDDDSRAAGLGPVCRAS